MRYATKMKTLYHCLPVIILLLITPVTNAEMYKHKNADGVTTYTDVEEEGATQITPPTGNTIKLPKFVAQKKAANVTKAHYDSFLIVSPQNDATFRNNNGVIPITLSLSPELDSADGHSISAYIDGTKAVTNGSSLSLSINNVDRGSHTIYAVVYDSAAKMLIQSNSVTVHFKQTSILH